MNEPARDGRIAFVFAMPIELEPLARTLALTETRDRRRARCTKERSTVATSSRSSPAWAPSSRPRARARLLDAVPVRWVLVVGITGALENETPIGTLVLPEIVVNSETGREFRPAPLADGTPAGKMWTTNGLTTELRRSRRAPRARCRVARHGDRGDRRALRGARHPVVGVPRHLRPRERRHRRRRGVPPQQPGRHANREAIERYIAGAPRTAAAARADGRRREARDAHRGRRRDRRAARGSPDALRDHRRGMAGILSAIKLTEAGFTDFTVYEKGDRLGGTWRENTYPGLACDVPSHLYSYSFALTPDWSHRFSPGPEIRAYFERVAREHDVIDARALRRRGHALHVRERPLAARDRERSPRRGRRRDRGDRRAAPPALSRHRRARLVRGRDVPQRALGSRRVDRRRARRHHRHRLDRGADGLRRSSTASRSSSLFQRTAQWIMPQENPAYTDEEKAAFRDDPDRLPAAAHAARARCSASSPTRSSTPTRPRSR